MTYTAATSTEEMQKRIVDAYAKWFGLEELGMFWKNGVAGNVSTPAKKSRAQPLPPVADAEYGPYAQIM